MAEGGNACWESQSEMATSGGPPSWLADWATLSCLRALARSSDSGQQLPVVWKSPSVALNCLHGCSHLLCEPRRAWFMGVQPTLRKTRSWFCSLLLPCWSPSYFLIESSHSVNLLWSCELCVQSWYFDMNMVRKQWTTLWSKCLVV